MKQALINRSLFSDVYLLCICNILWTLNKQSFSSSKLLHKPLFKRRWLSKLRSNKLHSPLLCPRSLKCLQTLFSCMQQICKT